MSSTIFIVEDEENARLNIAEYMQNEGYEVITASDLHEAQQKIDSEPFDILLLDVLLPDGHGVDILAKTRKLVPTPPVIMVTGQNDVATAVESMKMGAFDYIQKPVNFERLLDSVRRADDIVAMRNELDHYRSEQRKEIRTIVGNSKTLQLLLKQAHKAALASAAILITGETGTGKEVLARGIHQLGPRVSQPFLPINCAAIQDTMLESELFGYEPGAFTGADKRKRGLFELADNGILFLDEISSMSFDMQAKLLRVLEDHTFYRVGGTSQIRVDVQVISASNKDLKEMIDANEFRQDLYYRLNVVELYLPPLKERKEDIPNLVGHFIKELNPRLGMNINDVSSDAMEALINYNWPGNIRELRNVIERAILFSDNNIIESKDLPRDLFNGDIMHP